MSISFRGAKKYKKHNGFDKSAEIHSPLPAPVYFFNLVQNTDVTLSPLVEVGDTVEIGSKIADLESNAVIQFRIGYCYICKRYVYMR